MKKIIVLMLVMMSVLSFGSVAFAEEDAEGVAGCASVTVDPSSSLEFQQNICNAAEGVSATSCGASGHGTCSSPKVNDTLPEAGHCICISDVVENTEATS